MCFRIHFREQGPGPCCLCLHFHAQGVQLAAELSVPTPSEAEYWTTGGVWSASQLRLSHNNSHYPMGRYPNSGWTITIPITPWGGGVRTLGRFPIRNVHNVPFGWAVFLCSILRRLTRWSLRVAGWVEAPMCLWWNLPLCVESPREGGVPAFGAPGLLWGDQKMQTPLFWKKTGGRGAC